MLKSFANGAPDSAEVLDQIKRVTEGLFPGDVAWARESDPADPQSPFVVFTATTDGRWKDIRDKVVAWHDQVHAVCPEPVNYFRLQVYPR